MTKLLPKILIKFFEWSVFLALLVMMALLLSPLLPTNKFASSYVIVSNSMHPAISKGDLVFAFPFNTSLPKADDIIAFISPDDQKTVIVHRVISASPNGYKTQGDNNNVSDSWIVPDSQVIGRIGFTVPYFGFLVSSIQSPRGFALIIGLPALLLLGLQVKKIYDGIEEEIQKRTKRSLEKELNTQEKFVRSII